jgi:hypothetical protein
MKNILFASVGFILIPSLLGAQCSTAGLTVIGSKNASKCYGSLTTLNGISNKASMYYDYESSSGSRIACENPVYNNDTGTFFGRLRSWGNNSSCSTLGGCPSPASGNETIYAMYGTNSSGCLSNILMEACKANGTNWACSGTGLPAWTNGSPQSCGKADATFHVAAPRLDYDHMRCTPPSGGMITCSIPLSITGPTVSIGIYGDTGNLGSGGLIKGYKIFYECMPVGGGSPDCLLAHYSPVGESSPYVTYAGATSTGTVTVSCPVYTQPYLAYQYIFNNRANSEFSILETGHMNPMTNGGTTVFPYLSPYAIKECYRWDVGISTIEDLDVCAISDIGIEINYDSPPEGSELPDFFYVTKDGVRAGTLPPFSYFPGDLASHTYSVNASSCGLIGPSNNTYVFADTNLYPGAPVITGINDSDSCSQSGVQITYTKGAGGVNWDHELIKDGVYVSYYFPSGATYIPGDTANHVYTVQTPSYHNASCLRLSSGVSAADVNNTPTAAAGPSPADTATGVSTTPTLDWQAVSGATSYDVYFGGSNPPAFAANVSGASYNPGVLGGTTAYYWKVVPKNITCGSATGSAVWSFTTGAVSPAPGTVVPGSGGGSLAKSGSNILFNWSGAKNTCNPTTWEIYRGTLGDYYSHAIATCDTSGANNWTEINGLNDANSYYYLIVPATSAKEGSYGKDSAESEIPPPFSACLPQDLTGCN